MKAVGLVLNDWQLSGIWLGTSGSAYTVTQSYQTGNANVNLTGSPDFAPRIRIVGDPGKGCSSDVYRQFNTAAFQGPLVGSVGLESGNGYLHGCFQSVLDLSIARNIRLGGSRTLQLRVDMFNAPNQARITGPGHVAAADQSGRSGDAAQSAVRRQRQPPAQPGEAEPGRLRGGQRLPEPAHGSGVHPLRLLSSPAVGASDASRSGGPGGPPGAHSL